MGIVPDLGERLRVLLKEKAFRKGKFKLASGALSPYYVDARQVTLDSEGIYLTAKVVWGAVGEDDFDAIGGPTLGADPIVVAVAMLGAAEGRPVAAFLVRKRAKKHGLGSGIEGPLDSGARALLVEDVVTSGKSVIEAAEKVEASGATVVKVLALVDRLEGAREAIIDAGYAFQSIFTIKDLQA